ncbi:helix-turn-helix domain-containing protein [Aliikangiella coralliicola]|uniref:Helix-turn-helix transcriptional regulator n=1 Tax=Aliikangiella coralliicola TaxID=2592383 RepID=A0A545UFH1_9GAMM|nr:helix-turn-helix transcriptional regulator [Aliikangiella coralliicola]TQV88219.1 helix-turn-helix transcriptional regulator [Aliikangiella coralliicola]
MDLLKIAQLFTVLLSLSLAIIHYRLREKHVLHLAFAIFCASSSMHIAGKLTGDYWAPYHHLIGTLGFATCSGYWLFSRAFFRKANPINRHHLLFVGLLGACLILRHLLRFSEKMWLVDTDWIPTLATVLSEAIAILSSGMLILAFWEGYRVLQSATATQRKITTIYLSSFMISVVSVMLIAAALTPDLLAGTGRDWLVVFAYILILTSTHGLIRYRQQQLNQKEKSTGSTIHEESILAHQIHALLVEEKCFLESSLRVADIARELDVPEYRIRAIMLNHFNAKNFNHYVNQMRIEYAKTILSAPDKHDWPVLVVGIESGFASAAPFTRAFKEFAGCTPGQYRKQQLAT